jgi:carbon-monoxide dehydrogenase small subunit
VRTVSLKVNSRMVTAAVQPRTSLADFVRNECMLTGTHLGCEHGVCGACTVMMDDEPVRSCLTLAAAAEGRSVRTIEGYDGDTAMAVLRRCFAEYHALQCGFCTPGMLATAYDITKRLPDADRDRIKLELSGNICRCTGYIGIVDAIEEALKRLRAR